MPTKNTIKTYVEGGYYHIYNRGVDKREIFITQEDCRMFLHCLKIYLISPKILETAAGELLPPQMVFKLLNKNLSKEISLLSFSLMPNHFHLQIKQVTRNGIEKLMRRTITTYVQYFNRKYHRIGPLFESTYKAVLTETDKQHIYLSAYIHRNPLKLKRPKFNFVSFSSYPYYLGEKHAEWLDTKDILSYFKTVQNASFKNMLSYQSFLENFSYDEEEMGSIVIEDD